MINGTILQGFHWYLEPDGKLWNQIRESAGSLADMGITAIWIPPAGKGTSGGYSIGYDVYDVYDLGEFDQKGSVRTKYGTKEELMAAVDAIHGAGIKLYVDAVMNHMGGADEKEKVIVRRVNPDNRDEFISDPFEIEAYTKFIFPGRKGKYSRFIWDFRCFSGIDYAADLNESAILSIVNNEYGEGWEEMVDDEKGNYDYLMYDDIEFRNPAVREELKRWGKWLYDTLHYDGFRLDAVKHISPKFINEWVDEMRSSINPDLFAVAEYWSPRNLPLLLKYIEATGGRVSLFDACLQQNFHEASRAGKDYDLNNIFHDSLISVRPDVTVTVVANHDTQPLQALEAPVDPWFKPIAYALILLREQGYPCIFYADLHGAHYTDKGQDGQDHEIFMPKVDKLELLIRARKQFAFGKQKDYLDHGSCIGWTRSGDEEHEGCAVLISNDQEGFKEMNMGKRYAGKPFADFLQNHKGLVTLDKNGKGKFLVPPESVSVWVRMG
ncbi:MAG: alpha-amylase [Bacteroidota bacterium]|nr:alpha-amylase [Bacteroidota bacterium]MDP4212604.1 alpha-amylase [Bacteroidota bacterium]MDP4248690.1 alpha-amylase [Bacteroidota bacterium]